MDKPIAVGDLVMIVRPRACCPQYSQFGLPFKVAAIGVPSGLLRCTHCKKLHKIAHVQDGVDGLWVETSRLKRIDPPSLDESTETREEIVA